MAKKKKIEEKPENQFLFKSLTDPVKFGLYKNRNMTIGEIMIEEPSYIDWCLANFDQFEMSKELTAEFKKIKNKNGYKI